MNRNTTKQLESFGKARFVIIVPKPELDAMKQEARLLSLPVVQLIRRVWSEYGRLNRENAELKADLRRYREPDEGKSPRQVACLAKLFSIPERAKIDAYSEEQNAAMMDRLREECVFPWVDDGSLPAKFDTGGAYRDDFWTYVAEDAPDDRVELVREIVLSPTRKPTLAPAPPKAKVRRAAR